MKRLPPTLRNKHRYLKFKVHSESDIDIGDFVDAVWKSSLDYLGSKGCSEADFWVIGNQFNEEEQGGVIRVNRDSEEDLRSALTLIDSFKGQKGFVEVKNVSGSIKKVKDS